MTIEISGQYGTGEVVVNSNRVQAPYRIDYFTKINQKAIVLVGKSSEKHEDCDFELPEPGRNIVAINDNGGVVWTVSDAPQGTGIAETAYYEYIYTLQGNLYARGVDNRLYEIDTDTGEVTRTFDSGIFPIDGKQVSVDGWINKVIEFDERIFLRTGGSEEHMLYGFDTDGNELWKSEGRRGMLYEDGDHLLEKRQRGPRTTEFYRLDPETGERLAEVEAESDYWGWTYVRDISEPE